MAALSKIFAVATTYPYQVVRARLQDQHNSYNGVVDVIRRTWRCSTGPPEAGAGNAPGRSKSIPCLLRNEGAAGFYKGIIPNIIRVTPACCITFVVYENVSEILLRHNK